MSYVRRLPSLRQALLADAVISGATGALMFLGAAFLATVLNLPEALLRYAGLVLLPYAAFVAYVATRANPPRTAVWTVIVCNLLWAVDSGALLLGGWVAPSALGYAFVIVQALAVALFAELQFMAARNSAPGTA